MTRIAMCMMLPLLIPSVVVAGEVAGVAMPDAVTVDGVELTLNGIGLREKLWVDVYVAGLYLERASDDARQIIDSEQTKQLQMQFVYKVGKQKLTGAWTAGLEANQPNRFVELTEQLNRLNAMMDDVADGDVMRFTTRPGQGLRVEVKGVDKGLIEGDEFARAFWSIFLGDKPPTEKLKSGLLGGS
ncbi:MAG TPA: chalcone isomerase family protein [Candidatus Polarisedimenticolaceae bacterium]|nr:chalcone isomerase family protein [Candidatus Polarisedimenticolaceae bacterium]